jgi:hypothetical protein
MQPGPPREKISAIITPGAMDVEELATFMEVYKLRDVPMLDIRSSGRQRPLARETVSSKKSTARCCSTVPERTVGVTLVVEALFY